jgi:proton-dependent oligopeptide transporter, POT family
MANESTSAAAVAPTVGGFFGHPKALSTLFFTEYWERFSYYGMRALLILFMTATVAEGGLGFDTSTAGAIYGLYTAAVYLVALPGGWIADRLLGQRRAVFWGGVIISAGHFSMAVESLGTFFLGLVLIVIGTGLLKPNVSTMVGELYPEGGARRDAGFSIFYTGINLGAFVAPLICGTLGQKVDWHLGFAAAGIGMVFGLIQYKLGGKHLGSIGLAPNAGEDAAARRRGWLVVAVCLAVAAVVGLLLYSGLLAVAPQALANVTGIAIFGMIVLYIGFQLVAGGLNGDERKKMVVIFVLFVFSSVFWSGFEQAGSSLNLFADRLTDRVVFGYEIAASNLQSINPLFVMAFSLTFAWVWVALARRGMEPSSPVKFALGLISMAIGFLIMVWGAVLTAGQTQQVSPIWLILTYLFHSAGEICLSPVGLSTVTKLAPHRKVGQMMGVWFTSIALGNLLAGLVGGRYEQFPLPQIFGAVAATTGIAGILLLLLSPSIRRLMGGVH